AGSTLATGFGRALCVNKSAVRYYRKMGPGSYAAPVEVADCRPHRLTAAYYEGGQLLRLKKLAVTLWARALAHAAVCGPPRTQDVLELDGARHDITQVDYCNRDSNGPQRYRCHLTRENR